MRSWIYLILVACTYTFIATTAVRSAPVSKRDDSNVVGLGENYIKNITTEYEKLRGDAEKFLQEAINNNKLLSNILSIVRAEKTYFHKWERILGKRTYHSNEEYKSAQHEFGDEVVDRLRNDLNSLMKTGLPSFPSKGFDEMNEKFEDLKKGISTVLAKSEEDQTRREKIEALSRRLYTAGLSERLKKQDIKKNKLLKEATDGQVLSVPRLRRWGCGYKDRESWYLSGEKWILDLLKEVHERLNELNQEPGITGTSP